MKSDEQQRIVIEGVEIPDDFVVTCKWVTDRIALGGMIGTSTNMKKLREFGITNVLNLQAEFDDSRLGVDAGIEVLWVPLTEPLDALTKDAVETAVAFGANVLREPTNKLFVHCLAGRSRAPTFTFAILRVVGYERQTAIERILFAEPKAQLRENHLRSIESFLQL